VVSAAGRTVEVEPIELRTGELLPVRQVAPDDKELLRRGFERLSPESRYRRFFAPIERLTEADLRYLTEVDHADHEALVAIEPGSGEMVGVARYVRRPDPELAEAAIVVADDWQRRGVASGLLERLAERAGAAGITHFVALVLSDNVEALELFRHFAADAETRHSESGHVELLLALPDPGEMPGSGLAHTLREVARGAMTVNPYRVMRAALERARQR
jgi:GNAT superfamily N-acetyltransferase